jgi:hypothetical protein
MLQSTSIHQINVVFEDAKVIWPLGEEYGEDTETARSCETDSWQERFVGIGRVIKLGRVHL